MTRRSTFKKKIRERMKKTGERYAAARLALLQQVAAPGMPKGAAVLPGYVPRLGVEADCALLVSALEHAGVVDPATSEPFTETKIFGLSGGIGFMYFLFEYKGHPPMLSFYCRSWTHPWEVVGPAIEHAGVGHDLFESGGAKGAAKKLEATLEAGRVAHLTADFAALPWSGMRPEWVGQMPRQLNVVGRRGEDYLVDGGALRVLSPSELAHARSAPKKQKNRLVSFEGGVAGADPVEAIRAALGHTVRTFTEARFKGFAGNFGLNGLRKAAKLVGDGKDPKSWQKVFDSGSHAFLALYRTFECAMMDLTPPAGGRPFYAEFLEEASHMPGLAGLSEAAELARASGAEFERLADTAVDAGGKSLAKAVELSEEVDELRRRGPTESGNADLGEQVRALLEERRALAADFELDGAARAEVFGELGRTFGTIAELETRLVDRLRACSA